MLSYFPAILKYIHLKLVPTILYLNKIYNLKILIINVSDKIQLVGISLFRKNFYASAQQYEYMINA